MVQPIALGYNTVQHVTVLNTAGNYKTMASTSLSKYTNRVRIQ